MQLISKAAFGLVLLTGVILAATPVAHAQQVILTLGQPGSTTASGSATLVGVPGGGATSASGVYTYDDGQGGQGLPLNKTAGFNWLYLYGPSTASIQGGERDLPLCF